MAELQYKICFIIGLLSMFHAGYSATQHRTMMRETEQEYTDLPTDIQIQGMLSLILTMYGVMYIAGDFKEIRANFQLTNQSWDTVGNRPSFYIFSHRGRALSPQYVPPKTKSVLDNVENIS